MIGPVIYACCTDNIRGGKLCITLPHTLAAVYVPANALALESFLQYAGEREGGNEKCQRKHVFKSSGFIQ